MISEMTMKAIRKYAKYRITNHFGKRRFLTEYDVKVLRYAVKLDNNGYFIRDIYHTGKIKIKTLSNDNPDARARLAYVASVIWKENIHLEIAFMSNGTYIK